MEGCGCMRKAASSTMKGREPNSIEVLSRITTTTPQVEHGSKLS